MEGQNQIAVVADVPQRIEYKLHTLEKSNYITWRVHMTNILEAKGLLEATQTELVSGSLERQARALLTSALSDDNQMKVVNCHTAYKIWKRLEATYENKSSFERENLLNKLHSYKISSGKDISNAISDMENIAAKLHLLGEKVSDESLMSAVLRALPKQFSTFITVWKGTAQQERTIENLLTRLMAEVADAEPEERALLANQPRFGGGPVKRFRPDSRGFSGPRFFNPKNQNRPNQQFRGSCNYCKKLGHRQTDCWSLRRQIDELQKLQGPVSNSGNTRNNPRSERANHARLFMARIKPKLQEQPDSPITTTVGIGCKTQAHEGIRSKPDNESPGTTTVGSGCKTQALATDEMLRSKRDDDSPETTAVGSGCKTQAPATDEVSRSKPGDTRVPVLDTASRREEKQLADMLERPVNAKALMASTTKGDRNQWIADSGASVHITCHREWLRDYEPFKDEINITLGNDSCMKALGMGEVHTYQGILTEVFYVPEATENLFSISKSAKKGIVTITIGDKQVFLDDGEIIFEANLVDGLYMLNLELIPVEHFAYNASAVTLTEWHERFGHVNKDNLLKMAKDGTVLGMDIVNTDTPFECHECIVGKLHKVSHPTKSTSKVTEAGLSLHLDTIGPMPTESLGGAKYALLCKDECSAYRMIHFVESKEEIPDKVKECISQTKLDTGRDNLRIVTDNGSEFVNNRLKAFLTEKGIIHKVSVPYTPEQNGFIERDVRTITESARTMLIKANFNEEFWAEAMNTAVYTLNRTIYSGTGVTPYELWFGRKPNVKNLRVFGQSAVIYVPRQKRNKLMEKGITVVFIGYTDTSNTYRFINEGSNDIIITCDARFKQIPRYNYPLNRDDNDLMRDEDEDDTESPKRHKSEEPADENPEEHEESVQVQSEPVKDEGATTKEDCTNSEPKTETEAEGDLIPESTQLTHSGGRRSLIPVLVQSTSSDQSPGSDQSPSSDPTYANIPKNLYNSRTNNPPTLTKTKLRENPSKTQHSRLTTIEAQDDPDNYADAMSRPDKVEWNIAMLDEIRSLKRNEVWELVDRPEDANIVSNRWVLKIKRKPDGSIDRYKARLVARGFSQIYGLDYHETYAQVVAATPTRLLMAYAAQKQLKIAQFDVKTAFLYGLLDETIFMEQPEGFTEQEGKVCLLKKSLYGLKQAPRQWNKRFSDFLQGVDLKTLENDDCIFYRKNPLLIVAIYVDDGIILAEEQGQIDIILNQLRDEFDIHIEDVNTYLGFQIDRSREGQIALHQTSYVNKILKRFNMTEARAVDSPATAGISIASTELKEEVPYKSAVGSLIYAATQTRIDVAFAVGKTSRRMHDPREEDWEDVKRIFRYLSDKQDLALVYGFNNNNHGIEAYCDADFAGDPMTNRSTTGLVINYCGSPIHWSSKLQQHTTLSSTEAEVVSLCTAVKDVMWLRKLAIELDIIREDEVIPIYCDNQSAIRISAKHKSIQRTRHMNAQASYVLEQVENKHVDVQYIRAENQLADMLTKATTPKKFVQNRSCLMRSLLLLSMMMIVTTSAIVFDRVAPVVWTDIDKFVEIMSQPYTADIRFISPCTLMDKMRGHHRIRRQTYGPNYMQNQVPAAHIQQQGLPIFNLHQSPDQLDPSFSQQTDEDKAWTEAIQYCNSVYEEYIAQPLREINSTKQSRKGRQRRGITDMATGFFFSNILTTILDKFLTGSSSHDLEERESIIEKRLVDLKYQTEHH